ncbi:MAG: hypothetical protein ACNA78_11770 [Balneolaceae bacterium]
MILLTASAAWAQNEVERERISLEGLQEFGFTATVEGNAAIAERSDLRPSEFQRLAVEALQRAGIRFVRDQEVRSSADIPFLYMHINTMQLDNGLIPFSIQLRLYQPAELTLHRNLRTSVSTWEDGSVGLVSSDRISAILAEADNLLFTFLEEYRRANR